MKDNMKVIFFTLCIISVMTIINIPVAHAATKADTRDAALCPCSSADYCKGPRGGRYCVTKKGDKRYFKKEKAKA
jgi:hypothetical protein